MPPPLGQDHGVMQPLGIVFPPPKNPQSTGHRSHGSEGVKCY